jgi:hypothetical protein
MNLKGNFEFVGDENFCFRKFIKCKDSKIQIFFYPQDQKFKVCFNRVGGLRHSRMPKTHPMVGEKKDEGTGDPFKLLIEEAITQ